MRESYRAELGAASSCGLLLVLVLVTELVFQGVCESLLGEASIEDAPQKPCALDVGINEPLSEFLGLAYFLVPRHDGAYVLATLSRGDKLVRFLPFETVQRGDFALFIEAGFLDPL